MTTKAKVKTPLPPDVINDIIDNRFIPNARVALAKKHGISHQRVYRIWHEAYGGGTIECAKNCKDIKRPKAPEPLPDNELLEHQTPRGKYKAPKPKVQPDARANPRVVKKPIKYGKTGGDPSELDLDNIKLGDLPAKALNQQANLLAGQVQAGNNNAELLEAIHALLKSQRDLLSRATVNNLVAAQETAIQNGDLDPATLTADPDNHGAKIMKNNEKINESQSISDDSTNLKNTRVKKSDDSTKIDDNIASESTYETDFDEAGSNESSEESSEESGGFYTTSNQGRTVDTRQLRPTNYPNYGQSGLSRVEYSRGGVSHTQSPEFIHQTMGQDSGLRVRAPGHQTRAKPISKISKRPDESEWEEEPRHSSKNRRAKQEIYPPEQDALQGSVQPHHPRHNYQYGPRPVSSPALARTGGAGFGTPQQIQSRTILRPY